MEIEMLKKASSSACIQRSPRIAAASVCAV
jgi:hypothetical protein